MMILEVSVTINRGSLLLFSQKGLGIISLNQTDRKSNKDTNKNLNKSLTLKFTNNFIAFDLKSNAGKIPNDTNNRNNYITLIKHLIKCTSPSTRYFTQINSHAIR